MPYKKVRIDGIEIKNGTTYRPGSPVIDFVNSYSTGMEWVEAKFTFDETSISLDGRTLSTDGQRRPGRESHLYKGSFRYEDEDITSAEFTQIGSIVSGQDQWPDSSYWFGYIYQLPNPIQTPDPKSLSSWFNTLTSLNLEDFVTSKHHVNRSGEEKFKSPDRIEQSGSGLSGLVDFFEGRDFDDLPSLETNPANIASLYTAAFGRLPDTTGLQYWANEANDPLIDFKDIAKQFVNSQEFETVASPDSSSETLVIALYQNVLGREPDPAGLAYWANELNTGVQDRVDVLIGFANSQENTNLYESLLWG